MALPRIYNYHPVTGEYLGSSLADASPLDGPGVWLVPAYATDIEPPPTQAGSVAVFQGDIWINIITVPPEPPVLEIPVEAEPKPPEAFDVDGERIRRSSVMVFNGETFQTDRASFDLITTWGNQASFAIIDGKGAEGNLRWASPDKDFIWLTADNQEVTMDAPTMKAFAAAVLLWDSLHILAARAVKNMDPIPEDFTDDEYWPVAA